MSRQIQIRRGTAAEHSNFTGAIGEITMDTTNKTLHVHDGVTPGGKETMPMDKFNSKITNCITKIPQDIIFELNNGVLTLKSGSKIYVPSGLDTFSVINIESDINTTLNWSTNGETFIYYNNSQNDLFIEHPSYNMGSGNIGVNDGTYYYTNSNYIVRRSSGQNAYTLSFPLAKITISSNNKITKVNQIFNGFGYIGSTVFVLPGVCGIIPNGKNKDGSLKNTEFTTDSVKTRNINTGNMQILFDGTNINYTYSNLDVYNIDKNLIECPGGGNGVVFGVCDNSSGNIQSFVVKQVFCIADYNDFYSHRLISFQNPSSDNNYTWYRKYADGWVEQGQKNVLLPHNTIKEINLPMTMLNTDYTVITSCETLYFGAFSTISAAVNTSEKINLFQYNSASADIYVCWEVKGISI